MVNNHLTEMVTVAATSKTPASTQVVTGMNAMAISSAPIGDMAKLLGNSLLGGLGFGLMITIALTVAIAVIGTTLSCLNTAVRVTNGLATDRELPSFLSFLHEEKKTPHTTIWILVVISCIIAAIGIQSVDGLTGITLASNLGTFILYGLVCIWTFIAFKNRDDFSVVKHVIIPFGGLVLNLLMAGGIIYLNAIGTADNKLELKICLFIAGGWALISFLYVLITTVKRNYGMKMISAIIRPDSLDELVASLNQEKLIQGMTVTEVKGFGRQRGSKVSDDVPEKIKFLPKIRVDLVVNDWDVPHVMNVMQDVLNTGNVGDGKIFVFDAEETIRVRTGESGVSAI